MLIFAIPEGETEPDLFFMDMQDVSWDGSSGVKLIAPWDGHSMTATQSHLSPAPTAGQIPREERRSSNKRSTRPRVSSETRSC